MFSTDRQIPVSDLKTADLLIRCGWRNEKVRWRPLHGFSSAPRQSCVTRCRRDNRQQSGERSDRGYRTAAQNHYPALPLEKIPEMLERIEGYSGRLLTRLAVQLNLLIFIRSSELRFARWTEINLMAQWTIPAERSRFRACVIQIAAQR